MIAKAFAAIDALCAWISNTPNAAERIIAERMDRQAAIDAALIDLTRAVDDPAFIGSCAELAQLGMSAHDLDTIVHAIVNRRILKFSAGTIADLGEGGNWLDGSTRGSRPYEKEKP